MIINKLKNIKQLGESSNEEWKNICRTLGKNYKLTQLQQIAQLDFDLSYHDEYKGNILVKNGI